MAAILLRRLKHSLLALAEVPWIAPLIMQIWARPGFDGERGIICSILLTFIARDALTYRLQTREGTSEMERAFEEKGVSAEKVAFEEKGVSAEKVAFEEKGIFAEKVGGSLVVAIINVFMPA
ncbi:hypothetical protein Tco_1534719 [Tanacetum coccineum]